MPYKKQKRLGVMAMGAVKTGSDQFLDFLMMAGISPDLQCGAGKTLSHYAAEFAIQTGNAEVLRKLVRYGANLYIKAKDGRTVLDVLKSHPRLEDEVRLLWMQGSRNNGVKEARGIFTDGHKDRPKKTGVACPVLKQVKALRGGNPAKNKVLTRPRRRGEDDGHIRQDNSPVLKIS